jgi:hypothetical protein
MTKEEEESAEEGSDEEDEEVEKKSARKSQVASQVEIQLVLKKLDVKGSALAIYDIGALDGFCKKSEITYGDIEELKKIMAEVMFLGFRWQDVFSKLRKKAVEAKIPKDLFIYHMRFFCAIYVERGSSYLWRGLTNLKNKEMKIYIQAMIKVYDVVKRRPTGGYAPDDATITRIVALFPDLVSEVIKTTNKIPIANEAAPTIKFWFKFPGGASLIPKDKVDDYKNWLIWYQAFGKVINKGVEPAVADVKRFGDAIHGSEVVSADRRTVVWAWV